MVAQSVGIRTLLAGAAIALLLAQFAGVAQGVRWGVEVGINPSQTRAARSVNFTLTLHNTGSVTVTVCRIDIKYDWDADAQNVFTGGRDIAAGGSEPFSTAEAIPALAPGIRSATVTVTAMTVLDPLCTASDWAVPIEIVANVRPVAAFSYSPATPTVNTPVFFRDESTDSDGQVVAWSWDFKDGTTSSESDPTHAFSVPGDHQVVLLVTDSDGSTGTLSRVIHIAPSSDLGLLGWGAIGLGLAAIAGATIVLFRRRLRPSRRWGSEGKSPKAEEPTRWRPR